MLITGSTGFIGSNFCEHLEHLNLSYSTVNLRQKQWDYDWKNRYPLVKTIFHIAGINETKSNATGYFETNTELSKKVFDTFLKSSFELFVYVSSIKALSDQELDNKPLQETDVNHSISEYGISKFEAEKYFLSFTLPENKKVIIIRPCMVYGNGNAGNLNKLISLVKNGIPYPFADFSNIRSLLYVKNFCAVLGKLHSNSIESGIYHLSDQEYFSTNEILQIIGQVVGKRPKLWRVNKKYIIFIAKLSRLLRFPFLDKTLVKLTKNYRVDNSKLIKALDIKLPYSTLNGIKEMIQGK